MTFRITGSLPASLQKEIAYLRTDIFGRASQDRRPLTESELEAMEELHFRELDILARDKGKRLLEHDHVAEIVAKALRHFDGERYVLFAWVIMPNHVHVVFEPKGTWELAQILHSWKSFTANAANKALGHTGSFWQSESYDHLIRDKDDLLRCIEYTWLNPEKAGLTNWKWRWKASPDVLLS